MKITPAKYGWRHALLPVLKEFEALYPHLSYHEVGIRVMCSSLRQVRALAYDNVAETWRMFYAEASTQKEAIELLGAKLRTAGGERIKAL